MKWVTHIVYLVALFAQANISTAQIESGRVRLVPTNNIVSARSSVWQSDFRRIATNTPAFEEYGLNLMLTKANELREKWELDIPKPLGVQNVLFLLKATPNGIDGSLSTRDKRFTWAFSGNALEIFRDHKYTPFALGYNHDELWRLAKIESKITANEAETIARDGLRQLGLTELKLGLVDSPVVEQYKFEDPEDKIHTLPLFTVTWRMQGPKQFAAENLEFTPVSVAVSGITKNIVEYHNIVGSRGLIPTNYFQMLNLPTNYLETLPERTRVRWGLPPLTNTASDGTNSAK